MTKLINNSVMLLDMVEIRPLSKIKEEQVRKGYRFPSYNLLKNEVKNRREAEDDRIYEIISWRTGKTLGYTKYLNGIFIKSN